MSDIVASVAGAPKKRHTKMMDNAGCRPVANQNFNYIKSRVRGSPGSTHPGPCCTTQCTTLTGVDREPARPTPLSSPGLNFNKD